MFAPGKFPKAAFTELRDIEMKRNTTEELKGLLPTPKPPGGRYSGRNHFQNNLQTWSGSQANALQSISEDNCMATDPKHSIVRIRLDAPVLSRGGLPSTTDKMQTKANFVAGKTEHYLYSRWVEIASKQTDAWDLAIRSPGERSALGEIDALMKTKQGTMSNTPQLPTWKLGANCMNVASPVWEWFDMPSQWQHRVT